MSDDDWFDIVRENIDANQPLQYGYLHGEGGTTHSTVVFGYGYQGTMRFFHMNYGWGGDPVWEDITNIAGLEGIIRKIRPAPSLGDRLTEDWYSPPSFPYRYLNRNASGENTTFDAGHYLQFLSGVKVTCTSSSGGRIQFRGWSNNNTHLYADAPSRGIRIHSGHVNLLRNGSVKLH